MKRWGLVVMIVLTVLPLITAGLAVLFVLPDTISLHAGPGGIDRMGSKFGAFESAFIIAGCGVLLTVAYAFMEKLAAFGLVHGTDAHGGRSTVLVCQVFMNVLQLGFLTWMTFGLK